MPYFLVWFYNSAIGFEFGEYYDACFAVAQYEIGESFMSLCGREVPFVDLARRGDWHGGRMVDEPSAFDGLSYYPLLELGFIRWFEVARCMFGRFPRHDV